MASQVLAPGIIHFDQLHHLIDLLVLNGISSAHTKRAYQQALEEFVIWFQACPGRHLDKAAVQSYRAELESKGLAPSSINIRISAIRRLVLEAADNGLLQPEVSAAIGRVHGARRAGTRLGNWLSREQAEELLTAPDPTTRIGRRDRALLAVLLGAGLRRSEASRLTFEHLQLRDGRWVIADLLGKHNRVRTIPIPTWCKAIIDEWAAVAGVNTGPVLLRLDKSGRVWRTRLSEQAIFTIVKTYAAALGITLAPHDLRRTWAHLAHKGAAPLEQIQLSLGHASVVTTELYLGVKQNLQDAPCDHLGLEPTCDRRTL
jgi:site-specific recombinase XerD